MYIQEKLKCLINFRKVQLAGLQEDTANQDFGLDRLRWLESDFDINVYINHLTMLTYKISHGCFKSRF